MAFSEPYILVSDSTSFGRQQRIARLVAHEIAHQWFGNLATMQWWKYLWLKEGVVRYLEYSIITKYFPEWNYWTHFVRDIYDHAMVADASAGAHPVEAEVHHPKEIKEIFDLLR